MRNLMIAAALLALPIAARAQESDAQWLDHCRSAKWNAGGSVACDVQVKTIPAMQSLTIRPDVNGGVSVAEYDGKNIEVHTRAQGSANTNAAAATLLRAVRVEIGRSISVSGPPAGRDRSWAVFFVVYVPRGTAIDVATVNGPIQVRDLVADMQLSTANGPISLLGVGGAVTAVAQNGPLHVRLAGSTWQGAGLNARSENGPVELEVPSDYNAVLQTGTINGRIDTDIAVTLHGRRITTKLGTGGPTVKAVTTNGPVSLRRT